MNMDSVCANTLAWLSSNSDDSEKFSIFDHIYLAYDKSILGDID